MNKNKSKKKILFLISTLTGGGAERALCNLTLALEGQADIDILVNGTSDEDYPHGGTVLTTGMPFTKNLTIFYQIKAFLARFKTLKKLKKEGNYDACISFMDSANFANVLTGNKYCKTILSERVTLSSCRAPKYRYIVYPLVKLLYKYADLIVTVSKGATKDLEDNFNIPADKLTTIYNGNDLEFVKMQAQENTTVKFDADKFHFVNLGRLSRPKGQWHLLRAFRKVVDVNPKAILIICGVGAYKDKLEELITGLNLNNNVKLVGFHSNPYSIMNKCQAFVSASIYEGFANVIVEGMACGLPVVSTDFKSSAREILAPDTDFEYSQTEGVEKAMAGLITPVCSGTEYSSQEPLEKQEEILAQAMLQLTADKDLYNEYRERALRRAEDFSMETTARQWLSLV